METGPILVHVVTQKGKGYGPAEASAEPTFAEPPAPVAEQADPAIADLPAPAAEQADPPIAESPAPIAEPADPAPVNLDAHDWLRRLVPGGIEPEREWTVPPADAAAPAAPAAWMAPEAPVALSEATPEVEAETAAEVAEGQEAAVIDAAAASADPSPPDAAWSSSSSGALVSNTNTSSPDRRDSDGAKALGVAMRTLPRKEAMRSAVLIKRWRSSLAICQLM